MSAPIDTEAPRFRVVTVEGYPITPSGRTAGDARPSLSATVIDGFYGTEHGTFASSDVWERHISWKPEGFWRAPRHAECNSSRRGREGALAAAAERCAELNAWHEREGWGE